MLHPFSLLKPSEHAMRELLDAILDQRYPVGSNLPSERELAKMLAVTRPTLREVLQRMESDGWLKIRQGKPTLVNDYWRDGGLNLLAAMARLDRKPPPEFILHLLEIRKLLAPAYTAAAIAHNPQPILEHFERYPHFFQPEPYLHGLRDLPEGQPVPPPPPSSAFWADFDWKLHHLLTYHSGNPVFTLILNGFLPLYQKFGQQYFSMPIARHNATCFYTQLRAAAETGDAAGAEQITRAVMSETITIWNKLGEV